MCKVVRECKVLSRGSKLQVAQSVSSYAWSAPEGTAFVGVTEDVVATGVRNENTAIDGCKTRISLPRLAYQMACKLPVGLIELLWLLAVGEGTGRQPRP